jgi:hypothetical protein
MNKKIILIISGILLLLVVVANAETKRIYKNDLLSRSKKSGAIEITYFDKNSLLQITDDNKFIMPDDKITTKKPSTAFWNGFGPGFFIHGLGHKYVEDERTANILFITEIASLSLIFWGAISDKDMVVERGDMFLSSSEGPQSALIYTGTGLFLASWIYDFVHAPIVAKQISRESKISISSNFQERELTFRVTLVTF